MSAATESAPTHLFEGRPAYLAGERRAPSQYGNRRVWAWHVTVVFVDGETPGVREVLADEWKVRAVPLPLGPAAV